MFKNYFNVALRNLLKYRGYTLINISGLAIGLACFMLIILYVQDELSYDKFHRHADDIYRVAIDFKASQGTQNRAQSPPAWAPLLLSEYPEIVNVARFKPPRQKWMVSYGNRHYSEKRWTFADSSAFKMFDIKLLRGDPRTALNAPDKVVLTEGMAKKYFAGEDPLGKIVMLDNQYPLAVSGVMQGLPRNSHFHFDFMASFVSLEDTSKYYLFNALQGQFPFVYTYVQLANNATYQDLNARLPQFIEKHVPAQFRRSGSEVSAYLQPMADIYLHSNLLDEIEPTGDITTVYIFSAIAMFILLIACINFMNLATARSSSRAREVGMRKVVGAQRRHLIQQFIGESFLFVLASVAVALLLVGLALPHFNTFAGKSLSFSSIFDPAFLALMLGATLFSGIAAGSYPAFFLSAFQPSAVLKSKIGIGTGAQALLRKGLIVFQFAVSIILIICTGVVYRQMDFMRNKKLGFDKEHVVVIQLTDPNSANKYQAYKTVISQNPNIINVSASLSVPGGLVGQGTMYAVDGPEDETWQTQSYFSDFDFVETMGFEVLAGRSFSTQFGADTLQTLMINETAARSFGWPDVNEAVGKQIQFSGNTGPPFNIIGVVSDFHSQSAHEKISPTVIGYSSFHFFAFVRIAPKDIPGTIEFLEDTWQEIVPGYAFDYSFLDDDFDRLYKAEEVLGTLLGNFTTLAIVIACLGLFGLVSFTAEQRTKEIGVRKTLGASVPDIVFLLSREFTRLVLIAFLVSIPVAALTMRKWLDGFAYHIEIGPWIFVIAGILALTISFVTVSYKSIRAALSDPVEALRYE